MNPALVESKPTSERHNGAASAWRVISARNFGPYFVGSTASASGTWFHSLAASVFVYELTHSAALLGVLAFCQFFPFLVLAPWAGRVADSYNRRRVLLVTQPASAATSAVLAVTAYAGYATVPIVLAVSLCLGSLNVFTTAAQMAMVPSLVSRRDVPQAVALNSITFNLARALGPPFAALVIVAFGTATAFAMNSISFVVFTIGLLLVTPAKQPRAHRATLRESVVAMRAQPRLVMHLAVVITVSFVSDPVNTEGAAIAHSFGLSPVWTGALIGFFGMGAVSAGVLVGGREAPPARIACTLGVMGCGMVGLGVSPWFGLALLLAGVAGFGYLSSNAAATSQLQLGVDDAMRGRIMALWSVGFLGARPVASLIDGALAGAFGVRAATVVMATPAFALGTAMLLFSRSHHQSGTPLVRES